MSGVDDGRGVRSAEPGATDWVKVVVAGLGVVLVVGVGFWVVLQLVGSCGCVVVPS